MVIFDVFHANVLKLLVIRCEGAYQSIEQVEMHRDISLFVSSRAGDRIILGNTIFMKLFPWGKKSF